MSSTLDLPSIISSRLEVRSTVYLQPSINTIATRYSDLISSQQTTTTGNEGDMIEERTALANALRSYAVEVAKIGSVDQATEGEIKLLSRMSEGYGEESEKVGSEISNLRDVLKSVVGVRGEKLEYDALAGVINRDGGTMGERKLEEEIKRVEEECLEIERGRERVEGEVREKEKAFQLLLSGILDLKRLLGEEGEEGEGEEVGEGGGNEGEVGEEGEEGEAMVVE
ncbi:hypothetical protein TrCOL_g10857 [Triparma columacea]|uniref:Uncharacterized protein n=1 Tax=Triparma columacea TaxID=722753 RepID=A0A9W7G8F3_9STRA|nr:hypothetical protein TrCOL_g10857 [Triparma columacea]